MPTVLLEAAEALVPLALAGLFLERSARRERRRIALGELRVGLEGMSAAPLRAGTLERVHEARMRRRALRLMARHRSRAAS